jgi:uncharacterized protein (TIGR02246 family)
MKSSDPVGADPDKATRDLYEKLIVAWNKRNARDYALLFAPDGTIVGFDGSQVNGQSEIGAHLSEIFSHHQTSAYVTIVREVRSISGDVTLLRANAGMVPPGMVAPGKADINPEMNAVQSMVAARKGGKWEIALFQNTPAAFHGKPELSKKLTEELRDALRKVPARD